MARAASSRMNNFKQITPFIHVPDIEAAVAFFEDILGFKSLFRMNDYAYVEREGVGIRMLENRGEDGAPPGNRRFDYYIDVRDVDALHAELKPKLDTLPPGDVHGPADKPYGQRELLVRAPDGNLIAFGQPIGG
jgi:catechol 2,3-dioxygenase-like lactoylglutathione lyase family enzyme